MFIKKNTLLLFLLLLLPLAMLASVCIGGDGWLCHAASFNAGGVDAIILWELRAPRTVLAALVGAALGCAGAAMQGYVRNPLAEPGLLGVGSGAALAGVLAYYAGFAGSIWLPVAAIAGACLATVLVGVLAGQSARSGVLVLAGVAVAGIAGAGVMLAVYMAPNPYAISDILFWLMGSFANRSWGHVGLAIVPIMVGIWLMVRCRTPLAKLSMGEDVAMSMGVSLPRVQWLVFGGAALAVGGSVSVAGSIGFVGLIVPHLLRPLVRHRPDALIVPSAIGGAILLVLADNVVRMLPVSSGELPVGVITALIGGPFFVWLVWQMRLGKGGL